MYVRGKGTNLRRSLHNKTTPPIPLANRIPQSQTFRHGFQNAGTKSFSEQPEKIRLPPYLAAGNKISCPPPFDAVSQFSSKLTIACHRQNQDAGLPPAWRHGCPTTRLLLFPTTHFPDEDKGQVDVAIPRALRNTEGWGGGLSCFDRRLLRARPC